MKDFKIEKVLGKGSFGSVYLVTRKEDNKIYALKSVIMDKLKKKEQENSVNEVRILASVNHPNVIGYKEAFWDDKNSTLNIVMEYADDGDLQTKIQKMKREGGFFNESLIWSYSIQMIEGLKALHDKKIMHRDLKSANIFLVKDKHQCKIGDMNVSKVIKEKVLLTQTGTPYYASPEVWKDSPYSYKSDLWSIGCVIYELCALRPPFGGKDLDELFVNVCKGKPERINYVYTDDLWKMILLLLQVDVNKRVNCDQFLNHPLIVKKIKEMKNASSDFKSLEDNKSIHEGILLKTIQFKDLRDIKSQLPTKKNYDKITRGSSFSDCKNGKNMFSSGKNKSNPNIFIKNNSLLKYNKNNIIKNIKGNNINNLSDNNKRVYIRNNKDNIYNNNDEYNKKKEINGPAQGIINAYNYIKRNPGQIKDNYKKSLTSETKSEQHVILTDIDGNKGYKTNKRNYLKNEKEELIKKFKIELENNKKEIQHKSSKDINIVNNKEFEKNKIQERIREYENKLKLKEEEKQKQKLKQKNSTELYNLSSQNSTNNYKYINNNYLDIINNFCKNINYNLDNNYNLINNNNNLNDNTNNNLMSNYSKSIILNSTNDLNVNNRKRQISSASARINSSFNLPITKINTCGHSREKLDTVSNEHIYQNKNSFLITEGGQAKTPATFFTKISGISKSSTSKNRINTNFNNNYTSNIRSGIIQLNNNCLTSVSKDNIFNKYYGNNKVLKNDNISSNISKIINNDNDNNSLINHRSNTFSSINTVNKRVTKKIVTYERKHKSINKIDSMRPSSAAPSKRILEFNQNPNYNYDYSNVSQQLQKYSFFNKDIFHLNNNRDINKTNHCYSNVKNFLNDKQKLTIENQIMNYNNKYNTNNNNNIIHKKIKNSNINSNINKKNSINKIDVRSNSYKNHEKDFFLKKRENNNRERDFTEPDLSPINNRLKNVKNDNSKLNFSMFNSGIVGINSTIGKNSFLHDNSKIGLDYCNNGMIGNKINKINEKQYYSNVSAINSQQIFNNFYSINTINSTNVPIKVVNVFNK